MAEFPELLTKPLLHNDATYMFTDGGFDWEEVRQLKDHIKGFSQSIGGEPSWKNPIHPPRQAGKVYGIYVSAG
jgi:hypothetical protein